MDILEAARLLRLPTAWERRFHDYELLLEAGISPTEASRISDEAEQDRQAMAAVERELVAA